VLALAPSGLTLALSSAPGSRRAWALLVAGSVATLAIVGLRRWPLVSAAWAAHARTLLAGATLLASAGLAVESLQVAEHALGSPATRFAIGLGWACAAGALSFVAVTGARPGAPSARLRRAADLGGHAPALLFLVAGAVANAEPHWAAIVTLWVLEVALLVLLVLVARRLLRGLTTGIPSWAVWLGALAAAIAAWSPRELRVEVFSVPLGVGLVVAGCFALGEWEARTKVGGPASARAPRRTLVGWPVGWTGSWALLGPGILALLGPSVLATFTDPQTRRGRARGRRRAGRRARGVPARPRVAVPDRRVGAAGRGAGRVPDPARDGDLRGAVDAHARSGRRGAAHHRHAGRAAHRGLRGRGGVPQGPAVNAATARGPRLRARGSRGARGGGAEHGSGRLVVG
jgi:hypothetical protein